MTTFVPWVLALTLITGEIEHVHIEDTGCMRAEIAISEGAKVEIDSKSGERIEVARAECLGPAEIMEAGQ